MNKLKIAIFLLFSGLLLFPSKAYSYKAKNVFIIIVDELRHDQSFGAQDQSTTIPNIWKNMYPKGSHCHTFYGNPSFMAQVHLAILTGSWKDIRRVDPKTNPTNPTIFEVYRDETEKDEDSCYFITSRKQYFYLECSEHEDYGEDFKPVFEFTKTEANDQELYNKLVARMKSHKPSLVVALFGSLKSYNKKRRKNEMSLYKKKLLGVDKLVGDLWTTIQTLEPYKNKTDLFFVNDHGDLITHEDCDDECKRYMDIFAIGPDIKQGYKSKKKWRQISIFHTALKILGIDPPKPKYVMEDFLKK